MDIQPQTTQPISDDQELAKVLAGVNAETNEASESGPGMSEIVPPVAPSTLPPAATDDVVVEPEVAPALDTSATPVVPDLPPLAPPLPSAGSPAGDLDGVKQEAITELRPLVDKLNLAPEERFDTYLLLIRSTDDRTLIAPAHEAAKEITDDTRRAQALLDIIKEIDFLSGPQQAA